jgi:SAM-dependent methyltransferase
MDRLYRELPPGRIPWNSNEPPDLLVELLDSGRVEPCRAVDLGCGTGNYSCYLASRGFEVTGIDISARAVELAERKSSKMKLECNFVTADLLGDLSDYYEEFEFAFDWEVLHHIFPPRREEYILNTHRILKPGGLYFSLCFSEEDPGFGGSGKYRNTPIGTTLYFSSEEELGALFGKYFMVHQLMTVEVPGDSSQHSAIYGLMEKP